MSRPGLTQQFFGRVGDTAVHRYTLAQPGGLTVRILDYGGVIQSLSGADGQNVVLGFPALADYVANNQPGAARVFLGAIIGRYANRIARGTFTLDGTVYQIPVNNGKNSLHGGPSGFDTKVWSAAEVDDGLRLTLVSPDGDQGYPGTLTTEVTYHLAGPNRLSITYRATTDAPTVVNLTNHTYWNLAGAGDIYGHSLFLNATHFCEVDETLIPTGDPVPVSDTPFDFRRPTPIGARIDAPHPQLEIGHGYDHNWVLDSPLSPAAQVFEPQSGRQLTMWTTAPGLQFYSGNFLTENLIGTAGRPYHRGAGFALEAQHFPDSPNRPDFPSTTLRPAEVYHQETVFELSTSDQTG